ncbi:MAG: hypothetical protein ACJ72F_03760 [Nitrososphaeraceae archaeon]
MTKQKEWYWNDQEWDKQDIETPIVLRLSKNFNAAAMVISEKLGFKSLDEYVSDIVRINVRMELEGVGNFEKEDVEEIEKQMALIDVHRQTDRLIEV